MNVCRCECTYLTSVRWWPQSGQCRCYWQAGRQFPSRRGHSASCEILGWACAGCHKRSWSSRQHGGAGSHNHSPYWCYTPVFSPYCSLGGSRGEDKKVCFNIFYCLTFILYHSKPGSQTCNNTWLILFSLFPLPVGLIFHFALILHLFTLFLCLPFSLYLPVSVFLLLSPW